jgi:hypothetical protein
VNSTLRIVVALVVPALAARDVAAQWNVGRMSSDRNQAYTTFGLDPAMVASVGYARVVPMLGREWQFGVEGGVVAADYDIRDFRARAQIRTTLVRWHSLHLVGSMAFITRGTDNSIHQALNFGSDFTGAAGIYRPSWFLAGEFGFDKAIITHVTHSDWYRQHVYPEAKDGWYLNAGGTFHYGATAGLSIGPAELAARAGWLRTEDFNDMTPPMYASLGIGFRF